MARFWVLIRDTVCVLLGLLLWLGCVGKRFEIIFPSLLTMLAHACVGNDFDLLEEVLPFYLFEEIFDAVFSFSDEHI